MKKLVLLLTLISSLALNAETEFRHTKSGVTIKLVKGNIIDQSVDTIVNAANKELNGGTGVNGALQQAAGPMLLPYCHSGLKPDHTGARCPIGNAVITPSFDLWNKKGIKDIIHAVGPVYADHTPEEAKDLLHSAYSNVFAVARQCTTSKSIALPSLSTGIYGFPQDQATEIALDAITTFLTEHSDLSIKEIRLVIYPPDEKLYALYEQELQKYVASGALSA